MGVILTTFGTSGDFYPMLAIVRALKDQGDNPVMVANPFYEDRLARAGIEALKRCLEDKDLVARAAALGEQIAAEDDGARVAARHLRELFA